MAFKAAINVELYAGPDAGAGSLRSRALALLLISPW
jgi:hypothetical protein